MNKIDTKALREKILDLAMRGKLVPQDPNDEPASVLLENIKQEKEQLLKEKVIKKQKPLPPIEKEEEPFEIPSSWEWVRLGNIGIWGTGSTPNRKRNDLYEQGTIPWVKTGDLNNGFITHQNIEENITELALEECSFTPIYKNNILIAMYGATIGKLAISNENNLMVSNQACCVGKLIDKKMNILYIYYGLKAFNKSLIKQGVGGAQPNISRQKIISFLLPLPPLQEQQRIVSKIEELFAELDKIDKAQETYDSAANKLRDKVLDCAMKGKLVPQDPNDEPASELLKRIEERKKDLIIKKKISKTKIYNPILEEEYPFSIPNNWCFIHLGNIANTTKFKSIKPLDIEIGTWILGMGNIEKDTGNILEKEYVSIHSEIKSNKYLFYKNDILYGKLNPYLKKILVAPEGGICTTEFIPITLYGFCSPLFYSYVLKSSYISSLVDDASYGATLPRVKPEFIGNLIVPLPPEKEQDRIIKRIQAIFNLL